MNFYERIFVMTSIQFEDRVGGGGDSIFIKTPSSGLCQQKIKSKSPANEAEDYTPPGIIKKILITPEILSQIEWTAIKEYTNISRKLAMLAIQTYFTKTEQLEKRCHNILTLIVLWLILLKRIKNFFAHFEHGLLGEKYPDTKFFLVRIFPYSNWIRRFTL